MTSISPVRPLFYNLFLVSTTCTNCGWSAQSQELVLAHGDGHGVAFTNPCSGSLPGHRLDVPVRHLYVERTLPWCYECLPRTEPVPIARHLQQPFSPEDFADFA